MKRVCFVVGLMFMLQAPDLMAWERALDADIAGTPGQKTYIAEHGSTEQGRFAVYVPSTYSPTQATPCVMSVHGHGEGGSGDPNNPIPNFEFDMNEVRPYAEQYGFIAVSASYLEQLSENDAMVQGIMERVFKSLNIDRSHVLYTIHTMGFFQSPIAIYHPELFTSFCVRGGNLYPWLNIPAGPLQRISWHDRPANFVWGADGIGYVVSGNCFVDYFQQMGARLEYIPVLGSGGGATPYMNEYVSWFVDEVVASDTSPRPTAPANLAATAASASRIDLTWTDASANETGFKIERKVAGGSYVQVRLTGKSAGSTTSYTDYGLMPGTHYFYRVRAARATNGGVDSDYSNEASATTSADTTAPGTPGGLRMTSRSQNSVSLEWNDIFDNVGMVRFWNYSNPSLGMVAGYKIYEGGTLIGSSRIPSFRHSGLTPNATYNYTVRACDSSGNLSGSSSVVPVTTLAGTAAPTPPPLPVRGLVMDAPRPEEVPLMVHFITDALPRQGINVLVMRFDYRYQYTSHPECVERDPLVTELFGNALSHSEVRAIAAACRASGVRLIPQLNLLSHQGVPSGRSGGGGVENSTVFGLLRAHPEFDETPFKNPRDRAYCPLHPDLHAIVFDLMDELADVCETDAVHCGMDGLAVLADPDCPRCAGHDRTELFANEVNALHAHLAATGREMWMWGDAFIDSTVWKALVPFRTDSGRVPVIDPIQDWYGASHMGIAEALHMVSTNIVISQYYSLAWDPLTPVNNWPTSTPIYKYFAANNFRVVSAPTSMKDHALTNLIWMTALQTDANPAIAARGLGMLYPVADSAGDFIRGYYGDLLVSPYLTFDFSTATSIWTSHWLFQKILEGMGDSQAPTIPAGVTTNSITSRSVSLRWNPSTDAGGVGVNVYRIYEGGNWVGNSGTTNFTHSGLAPNTTHSYTVTALDAAGNESGTSSPALVATTLAGTSAAPAVPAGFTATAVATNQIALSWWVDASNTEIDGFKLERSPSSGGAYAQIAAVGADVTVYTDTSLASGTPYHYRLSATNALGSSGYVLTNATTLTPDTQPPTTPTSVAASRTDRSVSLTWNPSTDDSGWVAGYRVYEGGSLVGSNTTTSFMHSGLNPSTTYSYSVSAYDLAGNESVTSAACVVTTYAPDTEAPSVPRNVTIAAVTEHSISLAWTPSTDDVGVASYWILQSGSVVSGTAGTNFTHNGLTSATMYSYTVQARDAAGHLSGTSSPPVSAMTLFDATNGLIGYWEINETSGTTAADSAPGHYYPGTLAGAPVPAWLSPGKFGNGLTFNHGDPNNVCRVNLDSAQSALTQVIIGNYTLAAWVKPYAVPPAGGLQCYPIIGMALNTTIADFLGYDVNQKFVMGHTYKQTPGDEQHYLLKAIDATPSPIDAWYHVAGVVSQGASSTVKLYVNGVPVGTNTYGNYPGTPIWNWGPKFFWRLGAFSEYYATLDPNGGSKIHLDDVRIYNRALSDGEILTLAGVADIEPPAPPTNVVAAAVSASRIDLRWTDASTNETGFKIERKPAGGSYAEIATTAANATNYSDAGLLANKQYVYRLRSSNTAGDSEYSGEASASTLADTAAPSMPANVHMTARTENSISLGWTSSTDDVAVAGYRILESGGVVGSNTVASFTHGGLTPNTPYSYSVSAYDAAGNQSATSAPVVVSTLAPDTEAPSVPGNVTVTTVTVSSVSLAWTASTDNVGVVAYRILESGGVVGSNTAMSFTHSGLTPNTPYSYTVQAGDAAGNWSGPSAPPTGATTLESVPGPTNGLIAYYNLDETSGTTATDSISGFNGTLGGNPLPVWTNDAQVGGAAYLQIGGSWSTPCRITPASGLNNLATNNGYTVTTWVKPRGTPGSGTRGHWVVTAQTYAQQNGNGLLYSSANKFKFRHYLETGPTQLEINAPAVSPINVWYHIAGVVDKTAGTMKLYTNGVLAASTTFPAGSAAHPFFTVDPEFNWYIGSKGNGTQDQNQDEVGGANINVDEIRFYNRALSAAEVLALAGGAAPDTRAPTLGVVTPANLSYTTNSQVDVAGTATDASGVASVTVNGVGASTANGFTNWNRTVTGLAVGTNLVTVVAMDTPGNAATNVVRVIYAAGAFDGNGDGLPDAWQIRHFGFGFKTNALAAPDADADGDRMSNGDEQIAGTDPTNSVSRLALEGVELQGTGVVVRWQSVAGKGYYGDRSTNLSGVPAFNGLFTNVVGQPDWTEYMDTSATGFGPFYYRIGVK